MTSLSTEVRNRIEQAKTILREEYRLKSNVDYAIIVKYHDVHVLVCELFADEVKKVIESFNLQITSFHTYP